MASVNVGSAVPNARVPPQRKIFRDIPVDQVNQWQPKFCLYQLNEPIPHLLMFDEDQRPFSFVSDAPQNVESGGQTLGRRNKVLRVSAFRACRMLLQDADELFFGPYRSFDHPSLPWDGLWSLMEAKSRGRSP